MQVSTDTMVQSQLMELPAQMAEIQMRFTEKLLKATLSEAVMEQSLSNSGTGTSGSFDAWA